MLASLGESILDIGLLRVITPYLTARLYRMALSRVYLSIYHGQFTNLPVLLIRKAFRIVYSNLFIV